jgi:hypothetical protein
LLNIIENFDVFVMIVDTDDSEVADRFDKNCESIAVKSADVGTADCEVVWECDGDSRAFWLPRVSACGSLRSLWW